MTAGMLKAQFSTEPGLEAAAIRYLSAGRWSHVDLIVPRGVCRVHGVAPFGGGPMLLGARSKGGVQVRPWNYAKFTRTLVVGCVVSDIDAAYAFAFAQIGKPYATRKIFDFFLHRFGHERAYDAEQKDWFCDELLYEIVAQGGVELLGTRDPRNLTPEAVSLSPLWRQVQG